MALTDLKKTLLGIPLTLVCEERLNDLETYLRDIVANKVKGDVIEAGVWKGGASIWMREVLNELGSDKTVIVADSFDGVPPPDPRYIIDNGDYHHTLRYLAIPQEDVEENFRLHSSLENVKFIKGWFKDTLRFLRGRYSLIRLDGDLYESTMDSMKALYPKLNKGGYCIIDDWLGTTTAGPAVIDYMASIGATTNKWEWNHANGVVEEMRHTGPSVHWKKLT